MSADNLAEVARDHGDPIYPGVHQSAQHPLDHRHATDLEHRLRTIDGCRAQAHASPAGLD
jgi:hypothetical protein